ncbi:OmpA family protein [Acinetobacter sp. YH16039]|jgi:OOP family OmpA-OmpF porin|uniref:OmpA family protein n=1 Tax=Acinetobacter sp. YH16039 TaxID=2601184 RepID=UPI0015D30FBB|nr:OmpA family protein [Acinetobacter sp. YH16039]
MKLRKIALVLGVSMAAVTHAEVTLSPMLSYHFFDQGDDVELDDAPEVSLGLGYRITPNLGVELRYGYANPDSVNVIPSTSYDYHSLTAESYYRFFPEQRFQPYLLAGVGVNHLRGGKIVNIMNASNNNSINSGNLNASAESSNCEYSEIVNGQPIAVDNCDKNSTNTNTNTNTSETNFIGTLAGGAFYSMTDTLALRGEVRVTQDFNRSAFDVLTGVGLTYSFIPKKSPAIMSIDGDDDQDGVLNSRDKCPGTPTNVMVDEDGCPVTTVENLSKVLNVLFDVNQSYVKPIYYSEIEDVAKLLREYPDARVEIQGHTDSTASEIYNQSLSERRAQAIANILVNNFNISSDRVTSKGYGESQPIADNNTFEGRALNRRTVALTTIKVRVIVTKQAKVK